jgi:vancomycin resistance protein YoaR
VIVFDEAKVDTFVLEIAGIINTPPINASLNFDGNEAGYSESQAGRILDTGAVREQLLAGMSNLQPVNITLPILEIQPNVVDTSTAASEIRQIIESPITFYLNEPLEDTDVDLSRAVISTEELTSWLRIDPITNADGSLGHDVYIDENAVRNWLITYENKLYRQPVNARFYFNDDTRQLVLVETHINGRALDVDATTAKFMAQVENPNRAIAFVLKDIVPTVHAGATAADLGITELITENTTWFRGSSVERKHNISRAASNFYGIVVAPGETFSFNEHIGNISVEDGYETGLIIFGGRTIEGVGGGVCQVSTTIFQSAFWAGFPIEERWAHGYRVGYYDDGEGAGMDATIFNPVVDFRFTNNTPYHLLIENYYNEANESLTFKFYSTSMNRQVVKGNIQVSNVVPPNPDVWEFNPDLAEGEIEQVDWAVEGSTVRITREVFNENGDTLYGEETYESNYIPWQNVYQYGPGVSPPNSSSAPVQTSDG